MTTLSELLTIMRSDVLKDSGSTQRWGDTQLTRFINDAIRLSWPKCFTYVTDGTTEISQTAGVVTYTNREYSLPSGVPNYPVRSPVWKVELGPMSGQRDSDALQYTDQYCLLATGLPRDPAWWLDWSRDKIILRNEPTFDSNGTYSYFLRIHYVRPIAELTNSTDVIEGPPNLIPFLEEVVFGMANRNRMLLSVGNPERLTGYGNMRRQTSEEIDKLQIRYGLRMAWPQAIR